MRIALNATAYDALSSGARERFLRLYGAAARLAPEHEFLLYSPRGVPLGPLFAGPAAGEVETPFAPGRPLARLLLGRRWFARRLAADRADAFVTDHIPVLGRPRTFLTIHDLRFLALPDEGSPARRAFFRHRFPRLAARAARVVAVSETMRAEAVRRLRLPPEAVRVVPNGVPEDFRRAPPEEVVAFLGRRGLPGGYLLYLGVFERRKNLALLLDAHARAPDLPPLVLAGRGGPEEAALRRRASARVLFPGYVPEEDLRALLSGAAGLVLPSLYEGFGVPVLQAFACGTPVLAADAAALPETAGGAALLADPRDAEAWAAGMARIAGDTALRARLTAAGLARAAEMTWTAAARALLAVLAEPEGATAATSRGASRPRP